MIRGSNSVRGLFQKLLLCNKLPDSLGTEANHFVRFTQEDMGQEVSEHSAGHGPCVFSCEPQKGRRDLMLRLESDGDSYLNVR